MFFSFFMRPKAIHSCILSIITFIHSIKNSREIMLRIILLIRDGFSDSSLVSSKALIKQSVNLTI